MAETRHTHLLQAPRMSPDDLDMELSESDVQTIDDFENAWHAFLLTNPGIIPEGKRGMRNEELKQQIEDITRNKSIVETELKKQLEFFTESKNRLDESYRQAMAKAATAQKKIHGDLKKLLDNVAVADIESTQCVPWEHFFETLDQAVERASNSNAHPTNLAAGTPNGNRVIKPSARAMFLVDDSVGDEKDIQLRAYRIDHALLSAQVKSLQKDLDRYEKTTESLEVVGKICRSNQYDHQMFH